MKSFPRMLTSDDLCSAYSQTAIKFVPHMLSIFSMMIWNGLWFPLMLSVSENWLLASWEYEKIILVQHMHFQSFFLSTLFHPFLCPLSHVFALCLLAYVPCLMSLFLFSCRLSPVSRLCTLSPILCTLSHGSASCFRTSVPCLSTVPVSPFCGSIQLFLSFAPPSLVLFPCLSYLQECEFS